MSNDTSHLTPTDDCGPIRIDERWANADEYEGHLNGGPDDRIPGARWVRDPDLPGFDPSYSYSLAIPADYEGSTVNVYAFHVEQRFYNTYHVEGATPEDAWNNLILRGDGECVEQYPEEITSTLTTSGIMVRNEETGDFEDVVL